MNIYRSLNKISIARLSTCILTLFLLGLCEIASANSPDFKAFSGAGPIGKIGEATHSPGRNKVMSRKPSQLDNGIGGKLMCNEVGEESYNSYAGTYLTDDYVWWWESPDDIIYEESETVLKYSSEYNNFGFEVYNGAPRIEAIKIYLDPTKKSNASVRSVWADYDEKIFYYIDSQSFSDYDNNVIYWKNESRFDLDNIFFSVETGELYVIGFEIYSEGNTPADFFSSVDLHAVTPPHFSPTSCDFSRSLTVEITADKGNNIYYYTGDYAPTANEKYLYTGPIVISSTTAIQAIAADSNGNTSEVVTETYTNTFHGIGEGYNPPSPGDPAGDEFEDKEPPRYALTVVTNPVGAGSAYAYNYNLTAGESTKVYTYRNDGFTFQNWTIEGEEVSTETSFSYVMPDYDVTIVANYEYTPTSPGNPSPEEQKVKHPVTVRAIPSVAASMSPSGAFDMEENTSRDVYAYPQDGWKLTGWTINGEQQAEAVSPIRITMGEKALDIAAYFTYEPSSPSNPAANYYNPSTGQVIIDDFVPGKLYNALSTTVGYENFSNVSSLIVKGQMTSNDIGTISYVENAATIDLSRTGGITELPSYSFNSLGASSILLPATITSIGYRAFQNCSNLVSITIYAQVPPTCDDNTFSQFTNKENCAVYVPKEAIELYQNADQWKDFTILPIMTDAHTLQVNLPEAAADGRYKHYSIEIVNLSSGVRQKYVVSDRLVYTFNGLQKDEQYTVYLLSQSGLEIGRIDDVVIPSDDLAVTFDELKQLYTVFAKVLTPDDQDVTSEVSVEWLQPLDDGSSTYLRKATSIGEIPEGQTLICRVTLSDQLGSQYVMPTDTEITVGSEQTNCTVNLVPFRTVTLSGTVVDGDGASLSGASVSVNQTLNGKYSKTYTAKTDRKGLWNLSVMDAPETRITYAANECVNVIDTIGAFDASITTFDVGKTTMKSIVGARISYSFTYHAAGEEETASFYSDYQNVLVDVYNVTQDRPHKEISLQYPILAVLDENINEGDKLRLEATSKTGDFNPIEQTVEIGDNQRAEVTFDIVGKGGVEASFEMTDNPSVVAMLYSEKGELVKKQTYSEAKTMFTGLDDGKYSLVSMGQSDLMNSILRLSSFAEIGLVEGKDYVSNTVEVESGKLTEVKNSEIPAFDESLFYYTNSSTGFSANKSSITTGNYLTLRASIDFKNVYKNDISNVALVVDLPEACDFVEQSVIQGPNQLPYTIEDNRLIVQLENSYQNQIRFCVVPNCGGDFSTTASISFDYNNKRITQPIGTANSQIKDIEIESPSTINIPEFIVKGMGPAGSKVSIIDSDNKIIGSGSINYQGNWTVKCKLDNPINLKTVGFYAEIITPEDVTLRTANQSVKYNVSTVFPRTVKAISSNIPGGVEFNFNEASDGPLYYTFIPSSDGKATLLTYLDTDNPVMIVNMVLYVQQLNGVTRQLYPIYDKSRECWVATYDLDTSSAPVNVSLDYDVLNPDVKADIREYSSDFIEILEDLEEYSREAKLIEEFFQEGKEYTDDELETFMNELSLNDTEAYTPDIPVDFSSWSQEQKDSYVENLIDNDDILDDEEYLNILNSLDNLDSLGHVENENGTSWSLTTCEGLTEEVLAELGYNLLPNMQDEKVYIQITENKLEIIDLTKNFRLSFEENWEEDIEAQELRRAPISSLGLIYDIVSNIGSVCGTLKQIQGYNPSEAEVIIDRALKVYEIILKEFKLVGKELDKLLTSPWLKQWQKASELRKKHASYLEFRKTLKSEKVIAKCDKQIRTLEKEIAKATKAAKFLKKTGIFLRKCVPVINWIATATDLTLKGNSILGVWRAIPEKGCDEKDMAIIEDYRSRTGILALEWVGYGVYSIGTNILTDANITLGALSGLFTGGGGFAVSAVAAAIKVLAALGGMVWDDALSNHINSLRSLVNALEFVCPDEPENPTKPKQDSNNRKKGNYVSSSPNAQVNIDPSGYVYEAIPANRVEGVQATIYYKETKEDMYGDPYEEIILWDAEEYAQKNPLFTDENGMYQWDVPQGLWQVKFEKDGYATAYSEWLPVPPPQLEVNIGIVQNKQPEVTEARAYEDGIEVQFDKFMDLSTLTTSNIYVTANGEKLQGEIRLIDSALADEYASEDDADAIRYASRVRFVPEEKLSSTTGEVRLTVSRNVLSYAGIPMTETYSQALDVEKEVKAIVADDVKVLYGGEKELTISAIPFDAAVGRKLHIATSSDLIVSIDEKEVVLDDEGKATITVKGGLPGQAQLSFSIEDVTETGDCMIDVVTEIITAEAPKSSRASGTAVYRGSKIELTTESKDATIYFTTDGSCPCDENGTRRKYTVPIIINEDTKILAMTSVGNGDDDVSETVEFNYTLKRSDVDFQLEEGWTWISHNLETPVMPSDLSEDESISRVISQTQEAIRDPELGLIGNLTGLTATGNYKVLTTAATSRKRLSDIAWNPATPISVKSGWNWIGYPVAQTMTVDEAFATTKAETLDVVVGQSGFSQYDGENWIGTLETMSPGEGYMYFSQGDKNIVYNTSIVSKAAAMSKAGISGNSPLVVDAHKYASVMPVVVSLSDINGCPLDNGEYMIAAFSGSECRGISRLVKDLAMVSVYGEKGDPITFIVTDLDGEVRYFNDASVEFGDKMVGDIYDPYIIAIGDSNSVSEIEYSGNVKVFVDGDMLRVKGIDTDDIRYIEIFDLQGQKLLHETNISHEGIKVSKLSEGIYVVIVNGNGKYTYHKVAKQN